MAKQKDSFTNLTMFSNPRMFSAANGTPLVAHGIGTVQIATEFSEILVAEVYYALMPPPTLSRASCFVGVGIVSERDPTSIFKSPNPMANLRPSRLSFPEERLSTHSTSAVSELW